MVGGSPKVRLASGGSHGHSPSDGCQLQIIAIAANTSPYPTALQQPIRLAISLRQPAPVSFFWKETGAPNAAAAQLVQGIAAFLLVTIGVTSTEITRNSDADDGAAAHGMDCT